MITKGIIIDRIEDSNKYLVRIPIFETFTNSSDTQNLTNAALFEATLCYQPGNYDGLRKDDIVYIGFENNEYDNAIILGKLFLGPENQSTSHQNVNTLVVNGSTSLNGKVTINGTDISVINDHSQALDDLFDIVSSNSIGEWTIQTSDDNLLLNFFRRGGND